MSEEPPGLLSDDEGLATASSAEEGSEGLCAAEGEEDSDEWAEEEDDEDEEPDEDADNDPYAQLNMLFSRMVAGAGGVWFEASKPRALAAWPSIFPVQHDHQHTAGNQSLSDPAPLARCV